MLGFELIAGFAVVFALLAVAGLAGLGVVMAADEIEGVPLLILSVLMPLLLVVSIKNFFSLGYGK